MKSFSFVIAIGFAAAFEAPSALAQAPVPVAVLNPASNVPSGLPTSGIAQGSIFVIYGANLGPAILAQAAALPLPTTAGLSGTSIQVTVGGSTLPAPIVYTSATQVAGVLPSKIPVGTGTLTVTYNGQTGSTPISVVASNFGISTVSQSGIGPAVVSRPDYSVISVTNSARPGETLVIWGTGLGAIPTDDAATPVPTDLGTPIRVFLGTQEVAVTYRGRSGFPGLDQINIVVPRTSDLGCYESLLVQSKSTVSNFTTLPVAAAGGTCTDSTGIPLQDLNPFLSRGFVRIGQVVVETVSTGLPASGPIPAATTTTSIGGAFFSKFNTAELIQSENLTGQPSAGSCSVSYAAANLASVGDNPVPPIQSTAFTGLNAGTSLSLVGPVSFAMAPVSGFLGIYIASLKGALPGGTYLVSNGSGGSDVRSFSATFHFPQFLVWTNQAEASTVDRTAPFTVTWTGGDPTGYVVISGASVASTTPLLGAAFVCTAKVAAGKFTIPAAVLLSLPAGQSISSTGSSSSNGILSLESFSTLQKFQAPGLDLGYALSGSSATVIMTFK